MKLLPIVLRVDSVEVECPSCHKVNQDIGDILPPRACESVEHECAFCSHIFSIGWYAEVEVRDAKLPNGVK